MSLRVRMDSGVPCQFVTPREAFCAARESADMGLLACVRSNVAIRVFEAEEGL
jgi:hypothetical protein